LFSGPTAHQQVDKMRVISTVLVLVVLGVQADKDWKIFMNWAKTKAMESCWGEENMKLHTLNMKKAVAKCMDEDAPELDLPPFRVMDRLVNNLVSSADENEDMMKMMKFMMMMKVFAHGFKDHDESHHERHGCNGYHDCKEKYGNGFNVKPYMMEDSKDDMMDKMKMKMMMMKMMMNKDEDHDEDMYDRMDSGDMFAKMYKMKSEMNKMRSSQEKPWEKMMAQMRFRRDADDSLALNDRLKEKLEGQMEEHMNKISNMTCVLRELNVIDSRNNIDIAAMKADAQNKYKMPSEWFKEKYFTILDSCYEVAENLPADLDNMFNVPNQDSALKNVGKIKSFMSCCKSAKMKLCMNQDTKKKIETNFGPVEDLLEDFNNQVNEEQLFYMVNQLLQGSEEDFM